MAVSISMAHGRARARRLPSALQVLVAIATILIAYPSAPVPALTWQPAQVAIGRAEVYIPVPLTYLLCASLALTLL